MRIYRALIVVTLVSAATPVLAQNDHDGALEISRGDYASAERVIEKARRNFPHDGDLMLNLANVYQHTGRVPQAIALYRDVLTQPDETLSIGDTQDISAHQLAREALRRIEPVTITAR